jgi:hypothetical protein
MKKKLEPIDSTMFRTLSNFEQLSAVGAATTEYPTGVVTDPLPWALDTIPDYRSDPTE